jgi:hypothetical protein
MPISVQQKLLERIDEVVKKQSAVEPTIQDFAKSFKGTKSKSRMTVKLSLKTNFAGEIQTSSDDLYDDFQL